MQTKKRKLKIVITGGHLTPALAVLDELKSRGYENFTWIGHKYTILGDEKPSAEFEIITKQDIPFYDLKTGKLHRTFSWNAVVSLLRIPFGFLQALWIILKAKPDKVISFGGYLAVPIAFWGSVLGIPVYTHEQTVVVGRANKFIEKLATKVFFSWQKTYDELTDEEKKSKKFIISGNPVRKEIFERKTNKFDFKNGKKTVYITGGNQGSHIINLAVMEVLKELLKKYNIIHQCGSTSVHNDIDKLTELRKGLSEELKNSYIVQTGFWGDEIGAVFANADIVVSRAGANTVTELLALKKPSILIPIPWTAENEQFLNAKMVEDVGLARVLEQKALNGQSLFNMVDELSNFKLTEDIINRADELIKSDAESVIVDEITK